MIKDKIFNNHILDGFIKTNSSNIIKQIKKFKNYKNENLRICLNPDNKSSLHVMLIKFIKNKKINLLHYHRSKCEFYYVLKGAIKLKVKESNKLSNIVLKKGSMLYMDKKTVHSITPHTKEVIFIEIRPGPFVKNDSIIFKKN